ncbi:hypothetical protein F4780DRAFT_8997 [Xylariomycetidae sp. FL0641]|nr:hypothetical protein F4780DRAFT_8997 [Xylariomycetidae sp. FL0641]
MHYPTHLRLLAAAATLARLSAAHVVQESPRPYEFMGDGPSNPVSATGADFPCRVPPGGAYRVAGAGPTEMVIGEDQTLSFRGRAVHGGGSCQLALTRGLPGRDSPWQVIHSIEGGCPARHQKGNLEGPNRDRYRFRIPEGIEPGANWTLAWTWFPRIGGQGEMYMACSPVTVKAPSRKRVDASERRRASAAALAKRVEFPELFMANLGPVSGGCTTEKALAQQVPIAFPNPGPSVERPEGDDLFQQPCDGNPRAKAAAPPAPYRGGDGGGDASTTTSIPSATTSEMSSTSSSTSTSSSPIPTTSPSSTSTLNVVPVVPSSSSASSAPAAAPTDAACVEGHLTCLPDATHFATCTGGKLTAPQPIAPGFQCAPGEGVGLDISPQE